MSFEERRREWEEKFGTLLQEMHKEPNSEGLSMVVSAGLDELIRAFDYYVARIASARRRWRFNVEEKEK